MQPQQVLEFWFERHGYEDWFRGGEPFDAKCRAELGDIHARAVKAELWHWRSGAEGRLAEILLLDQLSRQLHRGDRRAFASDTMAVTLAQELVAQGLDTRLDASQRMFAYLPFEHAESEILQDESVRLFEALGNADALQYAIDHRETIRRFGRFPFRNAALGRQSTPEEIAYMAERADQIF
ncbi:DUF924 family protein [Pelagibacterium lacus]|uniref:DUF924 domain-containing protein n=1 Tax=Pelagibacterium lacus TaxID=2282655 RepID=A0A369W3N7_9HYPH|nr:DUF924 family protein [Pelagibacterium lacus]RDE08649.1 DUF924 domain-containing protein [Pelagibacterium lacus]